MHELQSHIHSQYVTLTYNDKSLPENGSLDKDHLQLFYKKLRKNFPPKSIRHFSCGEYGESCGICHHNRDDCERNNHHKFERIIGRPHYHAIIYGLKLNDRNYYTNHNGNNLYTSKYLNKVWSHGNVIIGDVTFESCAYVARYILKKITGESADAHYYIQSDPATGQDISYNKEFVRMSNRPGIATDWYNKYSNDIYNNDEGTVKIRNGIQSTPPRFYEEKFNKENPLRHQKIKTRRKEKAILNQEDNTTDRLLVKEKIFNRKIKSLTRTLE